MGIASDPQTLLLNVATQELSRRGLPPTAANLNMMKQHLASNPQLMRTTTMNGGDDEDQRTAGRTVGGVNLSDVKADPVDAAIQRGESPQQVASAQSPVANAEKGVSKAGAAKGSTNGDDEGGEAAAGTVDKEAGEAGTTTKQQTKVDDSGFPLPLTVPLGIMGGLIAKSYMNKGDGGELVDEATPTKAIAGDAQKLLTDQSGDWSDPRYNGNPLLDSPSPQGAAASLPTNSTNDVAMPPQPTPSMNPTEASIMQQLGEAQGAPSNEEMSPIANKYGLKAVDQSVAGGGNGVIVKGKGGVTYRAHSPTGNIVDNAGKTVSDPELIKAIRAIIRTRM